MNISKLDRLQYLNKIYLCQSRFKFEPNIKCRLTWSSKVFMLSKYSLNETSKLTIWTSSAVWIIFIHYLCEFNLVGEFFFLTYFVFVLSCRRRDKKVALGVARLEEGTTTVTHFLSHWSTGYLELLNSIAGRNFPPCADILLKSSSIGFRFLDFFQVYTN